MISREPVQPAPPTHDVEQNRRRRRHGMAVAIAIVLAATLLRLILLPALGMRVAFVTFYPAVMLAALYGGLRAGLLATFLSAAIADYFWIEPAGSFVMTYPIDILAVAFFVASGVLVSWVAVKAHLSNIRQQQADASQRVELERLVAERTIELTKQIAERKGAEAELRERERNSAAVMEHLAEGIMFAEAGGPIVYWNSAAMAIFGYASMEECRRKLGDFADTFEVRDLDDDRVLPVPDRPMSRVMRGEVLRDWRVRVRRLDQGWEKILSYFGWLIRGAHGETLAFVSTSDITERKLVEDGLLSSEKR